MSAGVTAVEAQKSISRQLFAQIALWWLLVSLETIFSLMRDWAKKVAATGILYDYYRSAA